MISFQMEVDLIIVGDEKLYIMVVVFNYRR